ncbi:Rad9/Ddc1 [Penicillium herquei]|nr:Rad9/Ddc1 [Penicillium herquei]
MTSLKLSLAPSALVRLHDALICLAKFSDTVAIEAENDLAMLSVFRGRVDRNKDTAVERCDMELHEDPLQTECRLTIKIICGLDVIKSYKLTYEPASIQHAVFDRRNATNQWIADPRFLKQIMEHFSPSAEQLDICSDGEKAIFTSFTTKVMEGKEILKFPVHTSVATDKKDFEEFLVEDNMHIAMNLKDFKAVVSHAETSSATVTARYTRPCKPLQLAYGFEGINAEFTIMTRGESDGEDAPPSTRASIPQLSRQTPAPATPAPISVSRSDSLRPTPNTQMPPPLARNRSIRPLNGTSTQEHLSQRPTSENPSNLTSASASMDFDSLFVPQDDDRQWDEVNEEDEPQDILGWDATGGQVCYDLSDAKCLADYIQDAFEGTLRDAEPGFPNSRTSQAPTAQDDMGIPPTQRMSQVLLHLISDIRN